MNPFRLLIFVTMLVLSGCSGARIVNALQSGRGVSVEHAIAYGDLPRQKYDLYTPEGATRDTPVVVFIYGGSWQSGKRAEYQFVGDALARRGFIVAIPDYRLYSEAVFPAFVEDAAKAVAAVSRKMAHHRLFIMGHSAGAHIAALVALDPHYLRADGVSVCRRISGFIGLAGPYDFLPLDKERYRRIFPAATRQASQPINFASGKHPPSLLIAGSSDMIVDPKNTKRLAAALKRSGNRVETSIYPHIGHLLLVGSLATPLRQFAPTLGQVSDFIRDESAKTPACGG